MAQNTALPACVTVAVSSESDADAAARAVAGQIDHAETCFAIAFLPGNLPPAPLAAALARWLPGLPLFGCTTAGQITPTGYDETALVLVAFPKRHFRCSTQLFHPLKPVAIAEVSAQARRLASNFPRTAGWNRLALVFADGLSKQEDLLVAALEVGLEHIPLYGGSAGNVLGCDRTFILHGGTVHSDAALLVLIETSLHFQGIGFDHFLPTDKQMVVTDAIPEERLVLELNGAPAAEEYARLVGCAATDLSPQVFAENPVLVRNDGLYHVRAIHGAREDGALSFLSAIDDGLVLTLGRGKEILRTLESGLSLADAAGVDPDFILGFDCYLRKLEIEQKQLSRDVSGILSRHRVLGFNTFGEQHDGVHVNQTFVGVAFFPPPGGPLF